LLPAVSITVLMFGPRFSVAMRGSGRGLSEFRGAGQPFQLKIPHDILGQAIGPSTKWA
jgi:hypothetical protein